MLLALGRGGEKGREKREGEEQGRNRGGGKRRRGRKKLGKEERGWGRGRAGEGRGEVERGGDVGGRPAAVRPPPHRLPHGESPRQLPAPASIFISEPAYI